MDFHLDDIEHVADRLPLATAFYQLREDDLRLRYFNDALPALFGLSRDRYERLVADDAFGHILGEDVESVRAAIGEGYRTGNDIEYTYRTLTDDGRIRWIMATARFADTLDGMPMLVVQFIDTTDAREAQDTLRDNYTRSIQEFLEADPRTLCLFHLNLTRNICDKGRGSAHYDQELMAASTVDRLFQNVASLIDNPREKVAFRETFDRKHLLASYANGMTTLQMSYRRRMVDGGKRWVTTHINLARDPDTGDTMAIVYSLDTDDDIIEEQITRLIATESYEYLALIDVEEETLRTYFLNQRVDRLGPVVRRGETMDYRWAVEMLADRFVIPEKRGEVISSTALRKVMEELAVDERYDFETDMLTEQGTIAHKHLGFTYLEDTKEHILMFQEDVSDVIATQQEQARELSVRLAHEQELRDEATRANAAKSEFLSRVSHDIRTPMNVIKSMTEFAMKDADDHDRLMSDLREIQISNTFLLSLIDDILDLSKIDSGQMELHPAPYAYTDFADNVEGLLRPLCEEKGIDFRIITRSTVGMVVIDRVRLNQVVLNLLSNAVKYTPSGGLIEFILDGKSEPDGRRQIIMTIRDNGIGMSKAFQKTMFEPFAQEYRESTPLLNERGAGLGLSIVKKIIDIMGGTIAVRSAPGAGTEFIVTVMSAPPSTVDDLKDATEEGTRDTGTADAGAADADAAVDTAADEASEGIADTGAADTGSSAAAGDPLAGKRVLIVEDHPINALIVERLLSEKKIVTTVVEDGEQAVREFTDSAPYAYDAILMDIQMPKMNGYEATRAIRALPRVDAACVPIIAMTADAFAQDIARSLEAGMDAHIAKPVDAVRLYDELAKRLDGHTREGG